MNGGSCFPTAAPGLRNLQLVCVVLELRTFVSHGSLSADERRQAEAAFAAEPDCAIVAMSTLELGIDVGELDRVIQVGGPPSVASFLQRMGRSGRRAGSVRNFLFLATNDNSLALVSPPLASGFVECRTSRSPAHIYAQQIMALALQEKGVAVSDLDNWLGVTFEAVSPSDQADIVDHMIATGDAELGWRCPWAGSAGVARQSGWEGGDDQECILTVAAD